MRNRAVARLEAVWAGWPAEWAEEAGWVAEGCAAGRVVEAKKVE